jgi:hypothetical protein
MKKLLFTMFRTLSVLLILSVSYILVSSCEKEKVERKTDNESTKSAFIVQDGILMFESTNSYLETIDAIANLSDKEREIWEEGIGFLSQRRIINNIINAELEQDSINEGKFTIDEAKMMTGKELHSAIYSEYLKKGVIKIIDEGTDDEYWDYSVFNRGFVDFINEDGLYAIGDTLYQVTDNSLKAMKNANFNNVQLLINATAPDEKNGIYFIHQESNLKATSPGLIENPSWFTISKKRIKIGIYLNVLYYMPGSKSYDFYHEVYVQCQEKNFWGNWKYQFTDISVNGSWVISVFYYPQLYGNSWSYIGYASYLKACINPATGITAPYQSYFLVKPNSLNLNIPSYTADQYDYQPVFERYNWSALRNGGCCGITATLKNY